MKRIRLIIEDSNDYYISDCEHICKIMKDRGYYCSLTEARLMWQYHSDMLCAGWMCLSEDDDIVFSIIEGYFEEAESYTDIEFEK